MHGLLQIIIFLAFLFKSMQIGEKDICQPSVSIDVLKSKGHRNSHAKGK